MTEGSDVESDEPGKGESMKWLGDRRAGGAVVLGAAPVWGCDYDGQGARQGGGQGGPQRRGPMSGKPLGKVALRWLGPMPGP